MVYSIGEVFNGLNKFCEEKTQRLRQSFSSSASSSPVKKGSQFPRNTGHQPPKWTQQKHSSTSSYSSSGATAIQSSTSGVPTSNFIPSVHSSFTQMNTEESEVAKEAAEGVPRQHHGSGNQFMEKDDDPEELARQMVDRFARMNCGSISDLSRRRSGSSVGGGRRSLEEAVRHKATGGGSVKSMNGMNSAEFRRRGRQMIDYIADYMDTIENRRVVPSIEPGYLRELIPSHAPQQAENFDRVLQDFESYIMPGVTHWSHPRFHAYFPAGNSFPSILADMLSDALGAIGFSWAACPAMTELEMHMLQWFGEMIGIPVEFLPFTENGSGGGVIQSSASECNFVALLAARFEVMKELRQRFPFVEEGLLMSKLIAYCSKEAHSSVEKAAMIAMVKLRILETDSSFRLRGETLQVAITEDRNLGLIPFFVSTTLGTTSCCSFDVLSEVGPVCTRNDLWLHVDAAYAGSAMICPEFRYLMAGIEHAMSFNTNPNKWMLVNYDCSTMWVKDRFKLTQALVVDPLYLQHSWTEKAIDYRHWGIPLSRRFRALKLWFVIRMYGVEGLQRYIREHVRLAKRFESLLLADEQFEIIGDVIMGLVCFRMKSSDEMNQLLLTKLNSSGRIHMVPASLNERFVIRFCVCHENATERDIFIAYDIIKQTAMSLFEPVPEPIVENYELEAEEAKQYDQMMQEKQRSRVSPVLLSQKSITGGRQSTDSAMSQPPLYVLGTPPPPGSAGADDLSSLSALQPSPLAAGASATSPLAALHDRRRLHTLAEKRSFLVRMVSDPKCYNPKIVRHLSMRTHNQTSQDLFRDRTLRQAIQQGTLQQRSMCPLSNRPLGGGKLPFSSGKYACMSIDQGSDEDDYQQMFSTDQTVGLQTPM